MSQYDIILDAADIDRIITRISHEILEKHKGAEYYAVP
jgi:pyrimidine operon attenuation protein/uracil phosphoribosyltransferase